MTKIMARSTKGLTITSLPVQNRPKDAQLMTRLAPLDAKDLPEEIRPMLDGAQDLMGFQPNDALVMARNPALVKGVFAMVSAVYSPNGKVDAGLKRLIGEAASKAAGCVYCTAHAAHGASRAGVDDSKIADLWSYETSPLFSDAERAAIDYAICASQTPSAVTDEGFEALRVHYDDDEIIEITAVIAMFGFLNRWNSALATELEDSPLAFAKRLAEQGAKASNAG
ncbi:MAG: carboxymuconolactone decarboxylase family protein [Pseudomonadota bacterium]